MLKGIAASEGIGIGKVIVIRDQDVTYEQKTVANPEEEVKRLHDAVDEFMVKTERLAEDMEKSVNPKEAQIIRGHMEMLEDPFMVSQMDDMIKDEGMCAEAAAETVLNMFKAMFEGVEDELIQQRATDIEDIKSRLLKILLGIAEADLKTLPPETVLVVGDLTPSMTAELNKDNVAAIVTESGGMTSHSAILSRALEIPAVLSVLNATATLRDGATVIVDGSNGVVINDPTVDEAEEYKKKQAEYFAEKERLRAYIGKESLTADGIKTAAGSDYWLASRRRRRTEKALACSEQSSCLWTATVFQMKRSSMRLTRKSVIRSRTRPSLSGRSMLAETKRFRT